MTRAPRPDYVGATQHVFIRGAARLPIAVDATDYEFGLVLLERMVARFELRCHAWCYLPNHFHLLLTSQLGNISEAMHWHGTCAAQAFNDRHERSGHVYQGRFESRVVESDDYLQQLARYIPLNPVKAGLCTSPQDWPWSSYAATAGLQKPPPYLHSGDLIGLLGSVAGYAAWVAGSTDAMALDERGVPVPAERPSLASLLTDNSDRVIAIAHHRHGYSKTAIARHLRVSESQIRRRLKK
jgi:REP element-mobilizing transposase RayT